METGLIVLAASVASAALKEILAASLCGARLLSSLTRTPPPGGFLPLGFHRVESVALRRKGEFHLTRVGVSFSLAFVRNTATNSATSHWPGTAGPNNTPFSRFARLSWTRGE